jgi:ferredoxin
MEIDVREGFQIECINCGRCIDACRGVMERRPDGAGLIDYRFGTKKGTRFKLGSKTMLLGAVTLALGMGLVWGLAGRSQSVFVLQRIVTADPQTMPDGFLAQPWRAIIGNRSQMPASYSLRVATGTNEEIALIGPVGTILVAPNEHREITFLIRYRQTGVPSRTALVQLYSGSALVATVQVRL